jgi:integrase
MAEFKRGNSWVLKWRDAAGRQRFKSFKRLRGIGSLEEYKLSDEYKQSRRDAASLAGDPNMTLGQAFERYFQAKARKRSLLEDRRIAEHLKAEFGEHTKLRAITAPRIALYKEKRLAADSVRRKDDTGLPTKLSAASINRPLALLRHLLRLAHEEWDVLPRMPRVKLEKEPEGRIRWLESDEEVRLLDACRKSQNKALAGIVTVALETGMRKGEILGLTWDRIDLSRGVIRLEKTKSGKRREVPTRKAVYDVLAPLRASALEALKPGPDGELPELRGRVWPDQSIRTAFENAVAEAKLDNFRFHDCRHHFAS